MYLENWNYRKSWYHGSPIKLTYLLKGSTITQDKNPARIFSHKPSIVCIGDQGDIKHNGMIQGYLYQIIGEIDSCDVIPHPRSSMPEGLEWLINHELKVLEIGTTQVREEELLNDTIINSKRR